MKGALLCVVGNAEKYEPDVEADKGILQKWQKTPRPSHHCSQTCETVVWRWEVLAVFSAALV